MLLGAVLSSFFPSGRASDLCLECLGFNSHLELRNFSELSSSLHTYHSVLILLFIAQGVFINVIVQFS